MTLHRTPTAGFGKDAAGRPFLEAATPVMSGRGEWSFARTATNARRVTAGAGVEGLDIGAPGAEGCADVIAAPQSHVAMAGRAGRVLAPAGERNKPNPCHPLPSFA